MKKTQKKHFIFLASLLLLAMFTCILVEPAMAAFSSEHQCADLTGDDYCVSSCHLQHHYAVRVDVVASLMDLIQVRSSQPHQESSYLEEPLSSIFRPPLAI